MHNDYRVLGTRLCRWATKGSSIGFRGNKEPFECRLTIFALAIKKGSNPACLWLELNQAISHLVYIFQPMRLLLRASAISNGER